MRWQRCGDVCSQGHEVWQILHRAWTLLSAVSSEPAVVEDLHTIERREVRKQPWTASVSSDASDSPHSEQMWCDCLPSPTQQTAAACRIVTCCDSALWYSWMHIKQDVLSGCDMTPTSGCTSTTHILFLACTERIASILVPYWFSLYSPCSMNLWRNNFNLSGKQIVYVYTEATQYSCKHTCCLKRLHQIAVWWQSGTPRPPSHEASWAWWYLWEHKRGIHLYM